MRKFISTISVDLAAGHLSVLLDWMNLHGLGKQLPVTTLVDGRSGMVRVSYTTDSGVMEALLEGAIQASGAGEPLVLVVFQD
tara:strand:- start:8147 stop:8392 length:246 start_codon:yes stop_codon:yes gene_type:complete